MDDSVDFKNSLITIFDFENLGKEKNTLLSNNFNKI